MQRSLSVTLQLGMLFGLSLLAAVGTGSFGFLSSVRLDHDIEAVQATDLPRAQHAAEVSDAVARLELAALIYLNQPLRNASAEQRIVAQAEDIAQRVDASTDSELQGLLPALTNALAAHRAAANFMATVDGAVVTVPDMLAVVAREQTEYLAFVDEKARYGETRGLLLDPNETRFAIWAAEFETQSSEVADQILAIRALETEIISMVAKDIAIKGKVGELTATRVQKSPRIKLNRAMTLLTRAITAEAQSARAGHAEALSLLQLELQTQTDRSRAAHSAALGALSAVVQDAKAQARQAVMGIAVALAVGVAITLAACFYAWRGLGRPLGQLTDVIGTLANRQYDIAVPYVNRRDDIGAIARAAETLRDAGQQHEADLLEVEAQRTSEHAQALSALADSLHSLSQGDLTCTIETPLGDEFETLRSDFNSAQMALQSAIAQISNSSTTMNHSVAGIAQATEDLSRRTESSASALQQTSETLNTLTNLLEKAAASAAEANTMAASARDKAETGTAVLNETIEAMHELDKSSEQIVSIVDVVDDIAFQTNLLALNAGVEAARAGTAGKGFSVVAAEVQALALRSSEAAREIGTLLHDSNARMSNGVVLVDRVGQSLSSIVDVIEGMSAHISGIAETTRTQSDGLQDINTAVGHLEQTIQQNAAMFEQTNAATHTLSQESGSLARATSAFHTGTAAVANSLAGQEGNTRRAG